MERSIHYSETIVNEPKEKKIYEKFSECVLILIPFVVCHAKPKKLTSKIQTFNSLLKVLKTFKILCKLNKTQKQAA